MTEPAEHPAERDERSMGGRRRSFLPSRGERWGLESLFVRIVATGGIIGIGVALAAILDWQDVAAWIIGIVVSTVSVLLAALLWSSRTL
jgi:protein-S-isoprenylcysteine O-methyltransferase Ste14